MLELEWTWEIILLHLPYFVDKKDQEREGSNLDKLVGVYWEEPRFLDFKIICCLMQCYISQYKGAAVADSCFLG